MGLINYKDIDFNKSISKENKIINFNGSEIQIVNYLSANDKYDLIMITLQKAFEKGIYNEYKLKVYFDLHLIYMYTNIVFTAEDRADEVGLYDTLNRSGLLQMVKEQIGEEELNSLWSDMKIVEAKLYDYKGSLLTFLTEAIENLPQKAEKAMETLNQMDPELLKSFSGGPVSTLLSGIMGIGSQIEK